MDNNLEYRVFMNQFTDELQQAMNEYCEDESYSVDLIQDKIKVDGEEKDVLTVCYSDSNLGPILYFEDKYFWYQDGHTINDLVDLTMKQLECLKEDVPFDEPFTQKNINENIYLEPMNFEKHKEYLKDMPYEKVGDMALVARYMIDDANMFNIRYDFCRYVRMSPQEIFEIAHKNTDKDRYICKKVSDILADILRENGMSDFYISDFITENLSVSLYALSNQAGYMGASAITSKAALDIAFEKLKLDYPDMQSMYMMVSTKDEIMLVPDKEVKDVNELKNIHMSVQAENPEECITEHVFNYNGYTKKLTISDVPKKEREQKEIDLSKKTIRAR